MKRKMIAFAGLLIALGVSAIAEPINNENWIGIWQGSLDGQSGVTLTLAEDTGELNGTVVFNIVSREGGQPHVVAREPHVLINPRPHGDTLSFQLKRIDGSSGLMNFTVASTSDGRAEIHCLNCGADAPAVDLVKAH